MISLNLPLFDQQPAENPFPNHREGVGAGRAGEIRDERREPVRVRLHWLFGSVDPIDPPLV